MTANNKIIDLLEFSLEGKLERKEAARTTREKIEYIAVENDAVRFLNC